MQKMKKRQGELPNVRNYVAKHQWQRGGVHDKSNKAKRQKNKQQLQRAIRIQSDADFFVFRLFQRSAAFLPFCCG